MVFIPFRSAVAQLPLRYVLPLSVITGSQRCRLTVPHGLFEFPLSFLAIKSMRHYNYVMGTRASPFGLWS